MVRILLISILFVYSWSNEANLSFLQKAQENAIMTMAGTEKPNVTTTPMNMTPLQVEEKQKPSNSISKDDNVERYNSIMTYKKSLQAQKRFTIGSTMAFIAADKSPKSTSTTNNNSTTNNSSSVKNIVLNGSCSFEEDLKISVKTIFTKYCQSNQGIVKVYGELIPENKSYKTAVKINFVDFTDGTRMFTNQSSSIITNASGTSDNIATYVNTRGIDKIKKQMIQDGAEEVIAANEEYQTQKAKSETETTTITTDNGNIVATNTSSPDVLNTVVSAGINMGAKAVKSLAEISYENLNWLYFIDKGTVFLFNLTLSQNVTNSQKEL